jgi:uncharacterized membrane protein
MNGSMAFCPHCRKETVFTESGGVRQCTACGMQFELTEARIARQPSVGSEVMGLFQVLFRVLLIMVAIVVVGLAVLFAGCALMMKGFHM